MYIYIYTHTPFRDNIPFNTNICMHVCIRICIYGYMYMLVYTYRFIKFFWFSAETVLKDSENWFAYWISCMYVCMHVYLYVRGCVWYPCMLSLCMFFNYSENWFAYYTMYVCLCVCMYLCIYACTYVRIHGMHECMVQNDSGSKSFRLVCMLNQLFVRVYACMHVYSYVGMYVYQLYICVYVCMHVSNLCVYASI
jgi:hypothetical protein